MLFTSEKYDVRNQGSRVVFFSLSLYSIAQALYTRVISNIRLFSRIVAITRAIDRIPFVILRQ